jgi:hypothetical protein
MAKYEKRPKYVMGRDFLEMICAAMGVNPTHVLGVKIEANWQDRTDITFYYSGHAIPDSFGEQFEEQITANASLSVGD